MAEQTTDLATREAPQIRRVDHPLRILLVGVLLIGLLMGSFIAGRLLAPPSRDVILEAQETIDVTAPVERRIVDSRISLAGTIQSGASVDLFASSTASPPVVVRRTLSIGDVVAPGSLIGVVSGEPFFALPGPLPTYRDLARGDTGDDVIAFQSSLERAGLGPAPSGEIDGDTLGAVQDLFERNGFELAWGLPIPFRSFVGIPTADGVVTGVTAMGEHLDADTPLVSVSTEPAQVFFRADPVTSAALNVGEIMTVRAGSVTFDGTIVSIGEFGETSDATAPGRDVLLKPVDAEPSSLEIGTSVTVLGPGEDKETLAVPMTALRVDGSGDYVDVASTTKDSGEQEFHRVSVSILHTGGGWAALAEEGELSITDRVRVS